MEPDDRSRMAHVEVDSNVTLELILSGDKSESGLVLQRLHIFGQAEARRCEWLLSPGRSYADKGERNGTRPEHEAIISQTVGSALFCWREVSDQETTLIRNKATAIQAAR